MEKIVSTAFNFGQHFSTGVNSRTGVYQLAFVLGRLGDFELKVGYSPLSVNNTGFGAGWSLNVSRYVRAEKRLVLSDGRSYQIELGTAVDCQYLKLQDIKVTYQDEALKVTFKDGTIEQFDRRGYLHSITAPSGHTLTFAYNASGYLQRITNQSMQSLTLKYDRSIITISNNDISHLSWVTRVRVSTRLTEVILPTGQRSRVGYCYINGLYVVEYLYHPHGATEKLVYQEIMRLPAGGPVRSLPAVVMHETFGAGVPRMTRTYRYSKSNFLGFGLSSYTPEVDNLFETESNYTYNFTEIFGDTEVTQTFNKYHLLVEESVWSLRGGRTWIKSSVMEYYADTSKGFASQLAQYQLPKKQTVTYYDYYSSRSEETISEYDQYGNLTYQVDAYGIRTSFWYYPATGEEGAAPPAPSGIPCLLKEMLVEPRNSVGAERAKRVSYTYISHPSLVSGKNYPVISKESHRITNTGREILVTLFTYINSPSVPESHGALLRKVTTEGDYKKCDDYTYSLCSNVSLSTSVNSTCKYLNSTISYEEIQKQSLLNNKILSSQDRLGNRNVWTYDSQGRVTREVVLADSIYEQVTIYRYPNSDYQYYEIETKDASSAVSEISRVYYDALGREVARYAADSSGELVKMSEQSYDSQGRVSSRTIFDDFGGGEVGLTSTLRYDIWGEVSQEEFASGMIRISKHDKVRNTLTQYATTRDGGGTAERVVTYYDVRGEVIKEVGQGGETVITYDGYGAVVKRKDLFDVETIFTLDEIGRVKSENTGAITTEYTFTSDNRELVTEVRVNGTVVGRREYDALGRVTSESKGGRATTNDYCGSLLDEPSIVTLPDGSQIHSEHDTNLGRVIKTYTGRLVCCFTYDERGQLVREVNDYGAIEYVYYPNGLLKSESMSGKKASYTYSRQGQLLTLTDFMGNTENRSYDRLHRLQRAEISGVVCVTLSYDGFERLSKEKVLLGGSTIEHMYTFDSVGRLSMKNTRRDGEQCFWQWYTYVKGGRLASKKTVDGARSETNETYSYDSNGRVVQVDWTDGTYRPKYLNLGTMNSQIFAFDRQGNLLQVDTLFIRNNTIERNVASYRYMDGLLYHVRNSLEEVPNCNIVHDRNGNMTLDEQGRGYTYNDFGKLSKIRNASDIEISSYTYSANGLLVSQSVEGMPPIELFYGHGYLLNESQGSSHSRIFIVGGKPLCRVMKDGVLSVTALVTDYKGSVVLELSEQTSRQRIYTPYGDVTEKILPASGDVIG
ncbi:RHS repeat protein [Vibrio vulnificus]|nr:hypothetical protein [Vibrio vulnificus]HDU8731443.1 RHS repeat protein [Vibrio vulnificus]HDU8764711.1 RHS repeat protein [Vibrio vulnificus]